MPATAAGKVGPSSPAWRSRANGEDGWRAAIAAMSSRAIPRSMPASAPSRSFTTSGGLASMVRITTNRRRWSGPTCTPRPSSARRASRASMTGLAPACATVGPASTVPRPHVTTCQGRPSRMAPAAGGIDSSTASSATRTSIAAGKPSMFSRHPDGRGSATITLVSRPAHRVISARSGAGSRSAVRPRRRSPGRTVNVSCGLSERKRRPTGVSLPTVSARRSTSSAMPAAPTTSSRPSGATCAGATAAIEGGTGALTWAWAWI